MHAYLCCSQSIFICDILTALQIATWLRSTQPVTMEQTAAHFDQRLRSTEDHIAFGSNINTLTWWAGVWF